MDLGIAGKVALVIGGSRGIGRGCSLEFAKEGCKTAVVARSQGPIDECVDLCRKERGVKEKDIIGISADCVTKDGIKKAVDECTRSLGAPDIVLFNIDDGPKGSFMEIDDDTFNEVNRNNVMAFVWVVRAVMGHMQEKRWGRIITIGTNSVKVPHLALPRIAQNTYRVGAVALCKTLAYELGPWGITVNTMGTGGFATEQMTALNANRSVYGNATGGPAGAAAAPRAPTDQEIGPGKGSAVPRIGQPADMGGPVAFLASTRAWYINGTVVMVDGGSNAALM